ncbi:hypothetical protein TIFTF001_033605 [Ficus carica]|uniref:Uncharacterized protein n=2 Tax=Ficus carica TaxID=3494 RepID=A0AA88E5L6_FICCA|nr:hypothetical protein TIFTF001_033605 [Ficus carica]
MAGHDRFPRRPGYLFTKASACLPHHAYITLLTSLCLHHLAYLTLLTSPRQLLAHQDNCLLSKPLRQPAIMYGSQGKIFSSLSLAYFLVPMRSCTYLSYYVPLDAVLLLGTAAGLLLLE